MKIQILSDLHLEGYHFEIKNHHTDADVLVLAGDIGRLDRYHHTVLLRFLEDCRDLYEHVIYVAGNHEFYFYDYFEGYKVLQDMCDKIGVIFLQNETYNIDGINFFGSTLWTDMAQKTKAREVAAYLNDFRLITNEGMPVTTNFIYDQNELARYHIGRTNANVIITHHLPIFECVDPKWHMNSGNHGFYNTNLVTKGELWLFGHSHSCNDFWKDGTRFVSNQKGYGDEVNCFDPLKVVEI